MLDLWKGELQDVTSIHELFGVGGGGLMKCKRENEGSKGLALPLPGGMALP